MKAGTTSMYEIMNQHSRITMSNIKEVHFFDYEEKYNRGKEFYSTFFNIHPDSVAVGEATPIYLFHPEAAQRILNMLGEGTKIIIMLRNPANRTISHYKMMNQYGWETDSIDKALQKNLQRIENSEPLNRDFSYIERSCYYSQVKRYFDLFPGKNIKVVLFEEDFISNRKLLVKESFDFLEVLPEDVSIHVKLMPTTNPISRTIDRMVNTASPVNQMLKKIIPSNKLRKGIQYFANNLNSKPVMSSQGLDEAKNGLPTKYLVRTLKPLKIY